MAPPTPHRNAHPTDWLRLYPCHAQNAVLAMDAVAQNIPAALREPSGFW